MYFMQTSPRNIVHPKGLFIFMEALIKGQMTKIIYIKAMLLIQIHI